MIDLLCDVTANDLDIYTVKHDNDQYHYRSISHIGSSVGASNTSPH